MAFADKFKQLHWASCSMSMHKTIDDFWSEIENYKDEIAENVEINSLSKPKLIQYYSEAVRNWE